MDSKFTKGTVILAFVPLGFVLIGAFLKVVEAIFGQ